jgi:hypothetical protein
LGKHNRKGKYVGRHRSTEVPTHAKKKITGVLAASVALSLTPQMLGYETIVIPGAPGMAVIPPLAEIRKEVMPEPIEEPVVEL